MFIIWSNILYFIAAINSLNKSKYILSLLLFLTTIVSCLYHINYKYRIYDVIISIITFCYCIYLYYKKQKRNQYIVLSTIIMLILLIIPKKNISHYKMIHPFTHIFGGIATLLLSDNITN